MLNRKSEHCIHCDTCNKRSPLFNLLSNEELKLVNTGRFEVVFNSGENIIKQGTTAAHLIVLVSGMAKLYLEGIDRKNLILDIVLPWKFFGSPGLFTDLRYQYSVAALSDCSACFIPAENIRKVIRMNPDFSEGLIRHCNQKSASNFERLISLTQKQMHGRLADTLIYLSEKVFHDRSFRLNLTRLELGEMSNMTKESTTRILKEFEAERIIALNGKVIEILEFDKLREIALKG
ncbi:MAG: Crp/Fnr family transcriptional regulator [Bacteroidales bacterium]|nr:Crp/Fnr family transcriptional regulator [Bacteroidales bacterium]MCK9449044.1 Crp/Fnr family transcriptional regulator [Bacteroidales bacterium]MDD3702092.1 Crp/Fnr family transcriptional regulator [Bacteroidales bacterium]MDY0369621.1 Crp/Fnr family transcriptional regulator [Bacteroidales bacterium]